MVETFMTFAEISIGFAGFLAVIIALGGIDSRTDGDQFRINQLLSITFGSLFLALLPVLLHYYELGPERSVRISALAMAIYGIIWKAVMLPWYWRIRLWEEDGVGPPAVAVAASIANTVVQCFVYMGAFENPVAVYFTGLIYFLMGAVISLFVAVRKQREAVSERVTESGRGQEIDVPEETPDSGSKSG